MPRKNGRHAGSSSDTCLKKPVSTPISAGMTTTSSIWKITACITSWPALAPELRPLPKARNPHSKFGLSEAGFGLVSLTSDALRFSFIDKHGKMRFQNLIRKTPR